MCYLISVDYTSMAAHSPEVIMKIFRKCCISIAMDGTDDNMLWNSSEEVRNVRSECEVDKCTDCEDGDSGSSW